MLGSVTECLQRVKEGESFAQMQLFDRYQSSLLALANNRTRKGSVSGEDAESVVVSAFYDFLVGAQKGKFRKLADRQDLWQVLLMLLKRRAVSEHRSATAKKRTPQASLDDPHSHLAFRQVEETVDYQQLTPVEICQFEEEFRLRLQELTDSKLREVALAKLSGFSNQEIADNLECSLRSVERKLALIRRKWMDSSCT